MYYMEPHTDTQSRTHTKPQNSVHRYFLFKVLSIFYMVISVNYVCCGVLFRNSNAHAHTRIHTRKHFFPFKIKANQLITKTGTPHFRQINIESTVSQNHVPVLVHLMD